MYVIMFLFKAGSLPCAVGIAGKGTLFFDFISNLV